MLYTLMEPVSGSQNALTVIAWRGSFNKVQA